MSMDFREAYEVSEVSAGFTGAVREARQEDAVAWNTFVFEHVDGTFFHRHEWSRVLRDAFGHSPRYLLAEQDGAIVGILPLAQVRSRLFGNTLVSTPFCVYGGIIATSSAPFLALQEAAVALAKRLDVDYLEMRNRRRAHPEWPVKDLYCTFRGPIRPESEANMQAIPRKQRAMVRKGIQRELETVVGSDVDTFYAMYSESLRNLGTPVFGKRFVKTLSEVFGQDVEILTIKHVGAPVCSVLSFRFRGEILPYYGGGTRAARAVAGNDFMYWQVMEHAREAGLTTFDFGRSKRGSGAFSFKRNWGFEPEQLHYEYFLNRSQVMPDLSPVNPRYERMIRIWQRLPLFAANTIGPLVARYLG